MVTRAEMDAYERSVAELDPDKVEAARLAHDRMKRRMGLLISQEQQDLAWLMKQPQFQRYCYTILTKAGMGLATRHAHDRDYAYDAGRRALGLELQDGWMRENPDFAISLSVEQAKLEEAVNAGSQ